LEKADSGINAHTLKNLLWKATSGKGVVNLHHTITFYALERVHPFFNQKEYERVFSACVAFMGEKEINPIPFEKAPVSLPNEYNQFYKVFSTLDAKAVIGCLQNMLPSTKGRQQLGRFSDSGGVRKNQRKL